MAKDGGKVRTGLKALHCLLASARGRRASLVAQRLKRLPGMPETRVQSLGREDPLEKGMTTHSSTFAWKIPCTEKPGRLQSMGSQRVGHDRVTSLSLSFWLLLGIRSQLRCHLPKEMTTHSIKIALHPPKSACHFSPTYCLCPFSPWPLPLPKLVSFMYLFTFASPGFHQ